MAVPVNVWIALVKRGFSNRVCFLLHQSDLTSLERKVWLEWKAKLYLWIYHWKLSDINPYDWRLHRWYTNEAWQKTNTACVFNYWDTRGGNHDLLTVLRYNYWKTYLRFCLWSLSDFNAKNNGGDHTWIVGWVLRGIVLPFLCCSHFDRV